MVFFFFFFSLLPLSFFYPRFPPRLLSTSFCLPFSHFLCRFPAPENSSSFFSLRQPDYISYMSLPELSLSLSLYTLSLPALSRFLPSLHSPSSSSSLSRHYGDTLSLYQDKLVLARSLSLCVCVLLELKEFSSDANIQNKNYIVNNKM